MPQAFEHVRFNTFDIENTEQQLREHFGYSAFLPGQRRVVELLLQGRCT